jgi:hypothetical protein
MRPRRALKKGIASAMIHAIIVITIMNIMQTSYPRAELMKRIDEGLKVQD